MGAGRVFPQAHIGTRTPNELEQQAEPPRSEDSTTISTMTTGGGATKRDMPAASQQRGMTDNNQRQGGRMLNIPIPVGIKGTRSRPSTCGCHRRLTWNARTMRDVSRRHSRIKGRAIANGTPPDIRRLVSTKTTEGGASWTRHRRCRLATPNPDRYQLGADPVRQQAGTEGGYAAGEDRGRLTEPCGDSITTVGGRHRLGFRHKEGGTSWNGSRSGKGTGSSSALAAGTPGTAREGGPARVRRTRRCRRSNSPPGVCPSALFKSTLSLLAWCVHEPLAVRRINC